MDKDRLNVDKALLLVLSRIRVDRSAVVQELKGEEHARNQAKSVPSQCEEKP